MWLGDEAGCVVSFQGQSMWLGDEAGCVVSFQDQSMCPRYEACVCINIHV